MKKTNFIILLLIIIITILGALCWSFASGTISFNSNTQKSSESQENTQNKKTTTNKGNKVQTKEVRYYQTEYYYTQDSKILQEIELLTDGTFNYYEGYSNQNEDYQSSSLVVGKPLYTGTYVETSSNIKLNMQLQTGNDNTCNSNIAGKYACTKEMNFTINDNHSITNITDTPNQAFKVISKEEAKFIN